MGVTRKHFLIAGLLAVLLLALGLWGREKTGLPTLEKLPGMGQEAAQSALLGRERREILAAWGNPDGMLSGFFGDIYGLESGAQVIVYYDTDPLNDGTADSNTVPVEHVLLTEG